MEVVMTQSGNFKFHTPIFRVNNRQENIDFYQNTLGFKLLTEENALAVFTDWTDRNSLFVIEESPAYRCRAVEGPKKINKVVIKVSNPLEIEYLLARDDHQAKAIFQGEKGYAFETISPENGLILMHAEDDLSTLKTVEYADVEEKEDFKGVSDFTVDLRALRVPGKTAPYPQPHQRRSLPGSCRRRIRTPRRVPHRPRTGAGAPQRRQAPICPVSSVSRCTQY